MIKNKRLLKKLSKCIISKKPSVKYLDKLWTECVKERAGYKSERTKKSREDGHILHSHHILGKDAYALRYDLDNGICITGGEHSFIAHGPTQRANLFRDWALGVRKAKERLELRLHCAGTTDLFFVEVYLKAKLEDFKKTTKGSEV